MFIKRLDPCHKRIIISVGSLNLHVYLILFRSNYEFKKEHKIVAFFDDFSNSLSDESLWQISEDIKPRGKHKHK